MSRVKRGVTAHARHKKVLKAAKGYYGRRKNTIRIAKQAVEKAGQYAYRDRKTAWISAHPEAYRAATRSGGNAEKPDLSASDHHAAKGRGEILERPADTRKAR